MALEVTIVIHDPQEKGAEWWEHQLREVLDELDGYIVSATEEEA